MGIEIFSKFAYMQNLQKSQNAFTNKLLFDIMSLTALKRVWLQFTIM